MTASFWSRLFLFVLTTLVFDQHFIVGSNSDTDSEDEDECPYTINLIPVPAVKEIELHASLPYEADLYFKILLYYDAKWISCGDTIPELEKYLLQNYTVTKANLPCEESDCEYIYKNLATGFYCNQLEIYSNAGSSDNHAPCHSSTVHLVHEDGRLMSTKSRTILICSIVGISFLVITMTVIAFMYLNRRTPSSVETPEIANQQVNIPLMELPPRSPRSGRLFLLYHNDDASHYNLVKTLAQIFEQCLQWEVTYVNENAPNAEIERGLQTWVTDKLLQSDKIVVVSSAGALYQIRTRYRRRRIPENIGGGISNVFLVAWHLIVTNQVLVRNYKKLFQVRFHNRNDHCWLPEIVPGRRFDLPNDFQQLVNEILATTPDASSLCSQIQRRLTRSELYQSFCEAVAANETHRVPVSSSDSEDSCWIRPGV